MPSEPLIVREFEEITGLDKEEAADLKDFALQNQRDKEDNFRPVLEWRNGRLKAQNYVGIIQTRKGRVLEILPKVDFGDGGGQDHEKTKQVFLQMLRTWRGVNEAQFNESNINALRRFNMLEVFVRLFLDNLVLLTKRGLAKHYQLVEENLPCLKGRILFPLDIRANIANRARFYVQYDDFNANRPANRLIRSTIDKLGPMAARTENQQLLHQMKIHFSEIPVSRNHAADWDQHKIDRTMQHYQAVMQWVELFLFGHGLATFSGRHVNQCLLFPMEEIFEDFVVHAFRRYQKRFTVKAQGPLENLVTIESGEGAFYMKPDITLQNGRAGFILDTKWKRINEKDTGPKHDISQADMYQLYAYGKRYGCEKVALIYPQTRHFNQPFCYRFHDNLPLLCLPFNVAEPESSVQQIINDLQASGESSGQAAA